MASFMSDLLKPYVEKLINGTIAEARHVFCFTCITKEFEEERARLEAERITLGQRSKLAIRRDKDIQANVCFWEEEVDKLIQEDTKIKQTCFYGFCPNCKWRYKKGKELANNLEEMKRLIERGDKLQNIELPRRLPDVERCSSQNYISFKSRESKYKELLDALKDDSNYITGLQGMGGTGKTALAKEVGKQLKQSEQFVHVIDTTVSFTPDIKKIQDDIAGPLGLKWEDSNESDRPKKLWSRLTNGEKILLIMDDVWDQDPPLDFDTIGIPKRDNHKGCRVLVTSRSIQTFNKMDCEKRIELDLLTEEDAWIMFKKYADICDSSSKKLIGKGRKIANECKKLPVAIAVIASSLKGQQHREKEWDVILKSLKKPISVHGVDDDMVGIHKCLKFSYDYMKNEKAKGLFLLCSVFREDEEVPIEVLTRLCIGGGVFGEDYDSYDNARNQVVVAKNKLLDSSLLLEVCAEKVKMHDLVRNVAQLIANKEIRGVNLSDKNQKSLVERETSIKCLLCEGKEMDLFSCKVDGSKLETLIVFVRGGDDHECMEVPNSFFENLVKLRVLYFACNDVRRPPSITLPQSIQSLTNIRSILVDRVDLGDISVFANLQCLETLDLVECTINELSSEITKLEKFKLLKLEGCEIRRNNPFEVIERCLSLEELYFINSFNGFCQEITLPELQRYHISKGWRLSNNPLSKYVVFNYGCLEDLFSKETLKYCLHTTEFLLLNGTKEGWKNLMPEVIPIELGMNDLVELQLSCNSQLQCLIDTIGSQVPDVFSNLVILELERTDLEELFLNGPISFDSLMNLEKLSIGDCRYLRSLFKFKLNLCNLKTIKVQNCSMLVSLFHPLTSRSLVLLETLTISRCKGLEKIIEDERRELESIEETYDSNKSHGSMFPKLKVINIWGCHQLESIFPFLSPQDLPALEDLTISMCDGLKYIFEQPVELGSLRQMELTRLQNFIDIVRQCNHPMPSCVKGSSSTSIYGSKEQKEIVPIKCNILSWTHMCCNGNNKYRHKSGNTITATIPLVDGDQPPHDYCSESNSFCFNKCECPQRLSRQSKIMSNIKEIELSHVPKIKSIFIPRMLEALKIEKCDELRSIKIDTGDHKSSGNNLGNVFPKLKWVFVDDCEQLEYIFECCTDYHENNTEIHLHLPVLEILYLSKLPGLVAMCPKQYHTTFPPLKVLALDECSLDANIKSIGDFITRQSVTKSVDSTFIIKELSWNMEHFLGLEKLMIVGNSKVESIFCLNEVNEQHMTLRLLCIKLHVLPLMTCLFVGPKNYFALKNLDVLQIAGCEKLEIVFSTSIVRCLPQLRHLMIKECKDLKHIIEDDVENRKESNYLSSRTSFPKLELLAVINCHKLKCVFPISESKELPELKAMMIREADELEEIFKIEDGDQKVAIANLNILAFVSLPRLCYAQEIQFQSVKNRFVENCQNLSLISTSTYDISDIFDSTTDYDLSQEFMNIFEQLQEEFECPDSCDEYSSSETIEDFAIEIKIQETSSRGLTSLQELMNEQSTSPLAKTDATIKFSKLEGSTSEKTAEATMSTISETKIEQPTKFVPPMQKGIKISVEDGTKSNNVKTLTSSTHSKSIILSSGPLATSKCEGYSLEYGNGQIAIASRPISITKTLTIQDVHAENSQQTSNTNDDQVTSTIPSPQAFQTPSMPCKGNLSQIDEEIEDGNDQIAMTSLSIATTETNDQAFRNDDAFKKGSSNIEKQFSTDDDIIVSKFLVASQFPSKADPAQIGLSAYLLVKSELEQLVSKNHLDYKNLSYLTDFLVNHHSVRLKDTSLSNRYKGCAYNLLAELLKFLDTHSVLEVLGSCHSKFVDLLQDARSFGFNRDWLDGVERRALFHDIQVSQDALQKLLDSKQKVTKDVEGLRLKIEDLNHQLTSSEAVLKSIIQQEAALSAPIGY